MNEMWPIVWTSSAKDSATDEQVELAESYAAGVMRMLTLYRVGGTPITVQPHSQRCAFPYTRLPAGPGFHPVLTDSGSYANCFCSSGCGCSDADWVHLDTPVGKVYEVRVDGELLAPDAYIVMDGHKLRRTDGKSWPSCSPGFTVKYLNGYPVDGLGRYAAGLLAAEFLLAMLGKKCRLPASVTSLTRNGVTMEFRPGMFEKGLTGITEVDAWVAQWNPNGLRTRPQVYSPDMPRNHSVGR